MDTLQARIVRSIRHAEIRRARVFLALSLVAAGASAIGVVLAVRSALTALAGSAFSSYLSLIVSDADILMMYWREFAFSLAETAPLLALTCALGASVAFLVSMRGIASHARVSFAV